MTHNVLIHREEIIKVTICSHTIMKCMKYECSKEND